MEGTNIPAPVFAALGALLVALITGFFSFLNMVSSKENKVSEFRLAWIDGLREEIAIYTVAVQELLRLEQARVAEDISASNLSWLDSSRDAYGQAIGSLTRIQLRLNPKHLVDNSSAPEAVLISTIRESRERFNEGDFEAAIRSCENIRHAAAPLLKATWDQVKLGEVGYRRVRRLAQLLIIVGSLVVLFASGYLFTRPTTVAKTTTVNPGLSISANQPAGTLPVTGGAASSTAGAAVLPTPTGKP
ncbi:hypothetical protein G8A07_00020 [Roseateles sp. DAIF2]|uniref:hypothetical protein n=1 Tax=Roseateles sp. DAIF2 TaxID=2714952 RepID=UPI0018A2972F|nr:hypothetical protein [Roseateles sp. DAIF2]QPF71463.1 hypothetical protein G8A07_00020 [Roseateles sp. DAIF2]